MRYLLLDLDGVLTTGPSRYMWDPTKFDERAIAAIEHLLLESQAAVVVHSSWRKLPEAPPGPWKFPPALSWWYWSLNWFRELCKHQGANELAARLFAEAPFKFTTSRGQEIFMWIDQNHKKGDTYVVLDDEVYTINESLGHRKDVLVIETNDKTGLTREQANQALAWWKEKEPSNDISSLLLL